MTSRRQTATVATAFILAAAVTSCSTGELYGYTTPQDICGTTVDPNTVKPFLPPGVELEKVPHIPGSSMSWGCNIEVDKTMIMLVASSRVSEVIDIPDLAENGSLHLRNPKPAELENTSQLQIAADGALMEIPCNGHGYDHLVTKVVLGVQEHRDKSTKDQSAEIATFLRSYIPELVKQKCET